MLSFAHVVHTPPPGTLNDKKLCSVSATIDSIHYWCLSPIVCPNWIVRMFSVASSFYSLIRRVFDENHNRTSYDHHRYHLYERLKLCAKLTAVESVAGYLARCRTASAAKWHHTQSSIQSKKMQQPSSTQHMWALRVSVRLLSIVCMGRMAVKLGEISLFPSQFIVLLGLFEVGDMTWLSTHERANKTIFAYYARIGNMWCVWMRARRAHRYCT